MVYTELDLHKEVTYACGSSIIRLWYRLEFETNWGNSMQVLFV